MENLKIKAKEYLSNAGYGTGSNFNTELVISLMARFAEKQVNKTNNVFDIKTEECIIESAFHFENEMRLIVSTSHHYGVTTYSCDKNWEPIKYACKGATLGGYKNYTEYHKDIRKMHGEENLVKKRSTELI